MIQFSSHPTARIASDIFEQVKEVLGVAAASQWMFAANAWLDGHSPVQALRDGKEKDVRCCVGMLKENSKKAEAA